MKTNFSISLDSLVDILPLNAGLFNPEDLEELLVKTKSYLSLVMPSEVDTDNKIVLSKWLIQSLPILKSSNVRIPGKTTVILLSHPPKIKGERSLFVKLIERWIGAQGESTLLSSFQFDFCFEALKEQPLHIVRLEFLTENKNKGIKNESLLPVLLQQIDNIIESGRYGQYLIHKNFASPFNKQLTLIQKHLIKLLKKIPDSFDEKIFDWISHCYGYMTDLFKGQHTAIHLFRIMASLLIKRKKIQVNKTKSQKERLLYIHLLPTALKFPFGRKSVLGMTISLDLLKEYEVFEKKHIMAAINTYLPNVQFVLDSFYIFPSRDKLHLDLYLEIEKVNGLPFTLNERLILRKNLPEECRRRVEKLAPSIFPLQNGEEVIRTILFLSKEISNQNDIPQVTISFNHHSEEKLHFLVILTRVKKHKTKSLEELFKPTKEGIFFQFDQIQTVKYCKNYSIEANVFQVVITDISPFLRSDFSCNLYLARKAIVTLLEKCLREFRDYNGGMILKQDQTLIDFKKKYDKNHLLSNDLIETFFYSINPVEAQTILSPEILEQFASAFLKGLRKDSLHFIDFNTTNRGVFATISTLHTKLLNLIKKNIPQSIIYSIICTQGRYCAVFYQEETSKKEQDLFKNYFRDHFQK